MKKMLMLISSLFITAHSYAGKSIVQGSYAARSMQAIEKFMRKSTIMSEDLKKACLEHPEKYQKLGMLFMGIVHNAHKRPDYKQIDQAEEHLTNGNATLEDCLIAFYTVVTYGEGVISQGKLIIKSSEPTQDHFVLHSIMDRPFKAALLEAHETIEFLGKKMEWSDQKINEEKQLFDKNVIAFLEKNKK